VVLVMGVSSALDSIGLIIIGTHLYLNNGVMMSEAYRFDNARKVNSAKFPDGFIYIIKSNESDLYKIGVSNKPKRRIRDIAAVLPFEIETIFLQHYDDVYSLEKLIHDTLIINRVRREWFNSYPDDMIKLVSILKEIREKEVKENGSTKEK
jgi:hypothetical protein